MSESDSGKDTSGDFLIEDGVLKKYTGQEERVEIPEGVEEIAKGAFYHNPTPKEIVLPKSLKKVQDEAFAYIDMLEKINVSEDVEVGRGAFFRCYGLADEQGLEIVEDEAFMEAGFSTIRIPDSVTVIGQKAFYDCGGNQKLTVQGRTCSVAEAYATTYGVKFVPTNEQLLGGMDGCVSAGDAHLAEKFVERYRWGAKNQQSGFFVPFLVTGIQIWYTHV